MWFPTDNEVAVKNTTVIPKALFTLAREWAKAAKGAGTALNLPLEEFTAKVKSGTVGFSPEDQKVIQGVNGNGADLFAKALTDVTGVKWAASDRITNEEKRCEVKFTATIQKGDQKGEKVEKVFTSVHRQHPKTTKKKTAAKKTAAKKTAAKKTAAKK